MEWLKPPTDNLYKFVFVAGLLIAGFAVYWLYRISDSANELGTKYISDLTTFEVAYDGLANQNGCKIDALLT